MAYSIGFLKFFLIDTLREIIIFFFSDDHFVMNSKKWASRGISRMISLIYIWSHQFLFWLFRSQVYGRLFGCSKIFWRSLKLIRTTIHYDWMYRLSVAVSTKYFSLSMEPLTEHSTDFSTSQRFRIIFSESSSKKNNCVFWVFLSWDVTITGINRHLSVKVFGKRFWINMTQWFGCSCGGRFV